MRHRIKKIPNLSTLFNHASDGQSLLHSDKSTYFYKKLSYSGLWFQTIPLGLFAFALLLVLCLMIYPIGMSEKTYAATTVPDPNFSIELSIGDTLQSEEEVEAGVVGYIANNFTVSTTSAESYSIYLTPDTENGYTNNLIGRDYKDTITGVGSNVSVGEFGRNTWGYGLTDTNNTTTANSTLTYSTIPDGSKPIKTVSNPDDGNDTYRLVFAAKINDDKPADHYQSQAVLSVVGSPKLVLNIVKFADKTYMQENLTVNYCQSLPDGTTGQLIDGRDDKEYWVTVLGTGDAKTCWMTQDLDLDLGPNGPALTTTNDGDNLYKGSATTWTGGASVASSSSGWTTSNGNPTQNINWYERDKTHGTAHTSLGNLYSFEAATAGTGHTVTTSGGEVPGSICPAGWKLPLGSSSTATGSFNGLGLTSSNVTGNPYYFQMGGYINGSRNNVGSSGYYWSATSANSSDAYDLYFRSGVVNPAYSHNRYLGLSVRCVVR